MVGWCSYQADQAGLLQAYRAGGEHEALQVQPAHEDVDSPADLPQHVRVGHEGVLEDELAGVAAPHPQLVELLSRAEAGRAPLDDEGRDSVRPLVRVCLCVHDERLGNGPVRAPSLRPVQLPAALHPVSPAAH